MAFVSGVFFGCFCVFLSVRAFLEERVFWVCAEILGVGSVLEGVFKGEGGEGSGGGLF